MADLDIKSIRYFPNGIGGKDAEITFEVNAEDHEDFQSFEVSFSVADKGDPSSNVVAGLMLFHRLTQELLESTKPPGGA